MFPNEDHVGFFMFPRCIYNRRRPGPGRSSASASSRLQIQVQRGHAQRWCHGSGAAAVFLPVKSSITSAFCMWLSSLDKEVSPTEGTSRQGFLLGQIQILVKSTSQIIKWMHKVWSPWHIFTHRSSTSVFCHTTSVFCHTMSVFRHTVWSPFSHRHIPNLNMTRENRDGGS